MNQVLSIPPAASATTLQGALIGSEEDGVGLVRTITRKIVEPDAK
jgi:hypothetical protein